MLSMAKKQKFKPQFLVDAEGKKTHVYLTIEVYNGISKRLNAYEKLKKGKNIRWVQVSSAKSTMKKK
jgi:hypothetical protein